MIACHYDSKMTPENFLAATDSAVPCAQMINLATVMKKDLNRLKYQVEIIFNIVNILSIKNEYFPIKFKEKCLSY